MQKQYVKVIIIIATVGLLSGCNNKNNTNEYSNNSIENLDGTSLTFRGLTYNIIQAGGHRWLDRNLGSSSACSDYKGDPECWGDLYQWGRPSDGHQKRNSSTVSEISSNVQPNHNNFILVHIKEKDIVKAAPHIVTANWYTLHDNSLWQENAIGVCPTGWRVPTIHDFEDLNISSPKDAFHKIKLSLSGFRVGHDMNNNGKVRGASYMGFYWTSTIKHDKNAVAAFKIDIGVEPTYHYHAKASGNSVRCMKD